MYDFEISFGLFKRKKMPSKTPLTNRIEISLFIGTGSPTGGGIDLGCGGKGAATLLIVTLINKSSNNCNFLIFI
jgi:hypothetical protein